jgi:hypothetical protein
MWTGSGWPTRDYYRTPNDGSDPNSAGNVWPVDIYTHINHSVLTMQSGSGSRKYIGYASLRDALKQTNKHIAKCPLCLVMATTRPRDHCAMAARPPTRAADPSSALHVVPLPQLATTWFGDLSAATPPRPSTWFRDSSAATPPRPPLRVVPLLVDKVVGDIIIIAGGSY